MKGIICHISGKKNPANELYKGSGLRKSLFDLIHADFPDFTEDSYISIEELNKYRKKYLELVVQSERGELSQLDQDVLKAINKDQLLSSDLPVTKKDRLTFGQRLADNIAEFGGSWAFILSCLAAIQAPIIMMSQNRQEQKDRQQSEYDYKVNLKAELEIRLLHEKVDHLMVNQNQRLLEIQQIQADYMEDILKELKAASSKKGST